MKSARQEILEKLTHSPLQKKQPVAPDPDLPIYKEQLGSLVEQFQINLERLSGEVAVFSNEEKLFKNLRLFIKNKNWQHICCQETAIQKKLSENNITFDGCINLPENIDAAITGCEFLAANLGSVIVSSAQSGNRSIFVYPPVHIIVAKSNQIVDTLENAYQMVLKKHKNNFPSMISIISGPSRTADIEKTLVMGAHGPQSLFVFISG